MSLLKKLAGLAVGAAAVGAVAYVLQNREHHDDEYEHIWGPEDEVEPETDSAEPAADDASAEAEPAPAAAPEEPAAPAEEPKPEEPADAAETPAAKTPDFDAPNVNPVELGHVEASRTPDGKIDPTQIVDPAVAGDWEEQGCKGWYTKRARRIFVLWQRCAFLFFALPCGRARSSRSCRGRRPRRPAGGYGIRPYGFHRPVGAAHVRPAAFPHTAFYGKPPGRAYPTPTPRLWLSAHKCP